MKSLSNHRFSRLATLTPASPFFHPEEILASLRGTAAWLLDATEATGARGKTYRNVLYHEDGRATWLYPNSSTAEVISGWLDLASLLDAPEYAGYAREYADTLLDGPRGLYVGDAAEAHGLPWYWTDAGTFSGLYAMRMPFHFHRLHEATGEQRYLDICDVIGRTLTSRQLGSGIVSAAWEPGTGYFKEVRIGSRYIYATATFATLWRITGDTRYKTAYHRAVEAMEKMQNADGSLFQMYDAETAEPIDASIKLHFYAYYFDALKEAHEATGDCSLIDYARRLADHLLELYGYRQSIPYCAGIVGEPTDQMECDSLIHDSCPGLLWLGETTGEEVYTDVALKLWLHARIHQLPADAQPGWRGAIIRGTKPDTETPPGVPANRLHLHFDPTVIARCDLWFVLHHATACKALLNLVATPQAASCE